MEVMWLYSLCQCILSVSVIAASVRLCMAVSGGGVQEGARGHALQPGSVSCCLRLCLGWVGAAGGAAAIPVNVLLNQRTPQCLYTCITLVCCPLLVRQFTMFLVMILTLDGHLQRHLADRYSSAMTRQRALGVVLLCWLASVLSSFSQFIGSDNLDTWRSRATDPGTTGLELHGNWTTSLPRLTSPPPPKYDHERKVIGKYLPYGGFLSKFYVEDMHNFTYAEIHSSHWGVCAADTVLTPQFLVYVHAMTSFVLPLLCLLVVYLDLLCIRPRKSPFSQAEPTKHESRHARPLALSLSLLVLLCLPLHILHALLLFTSNTNLPAWVHAVAVFLFQLYSLVPQVLFTPPKKRVGAERATFALSVAPRPPPAAASRGKSVRAALREAVQASAKHSLKAKVFPEV
ncbi:adenosine receptor A1 isoform 1-T2 [Spinachia spinachia]